MATIAVFHSVLGVRSGILDTAERLRGWGHEVRVVDQYGGRVFDDYTEAAEYVESVGSFPALMAAAVGAVAGLPDGFGCLGFSNGAGMAEWVATQRGVSRVVLCSGALPLAMLGVQVWPAGVPVQIHHAAADPKRVPGWSETFAESVAEAGGAVERFDYAGGGHLFTDPSLPEEYDAESAELFHERVAKFFGG